ncbi:CheW domain protein [Stanieria cyanosphaera PCC 7437]|uniref:CheW domain protein n=1 Tax=Stanieria cyanosphaera (strain ATCC 29371 / PCC 7437) TaxID=111780 RepID=K9XWM2_STAC7|nr:chemotaxis protein CheW [Stanieria cyanosphaera]AFZ36928.1 CheW domain protein [Stanieria cyanosphaera PCC 7437]
MIQNYFSVSLSTPWKVALPLTDVETVIKLEPTEIAIIPGIAQFWYGVTNYRGNLLWVLDTEEFFKINSFQVNSLEKLTAVVLTTKIEGITKKVAFTAKGLEGVISIKLDSLSILSTQTKSQFSNSFVSQFQENDILFYLLDVQQLFKELSQKSELLPV